jgi:hypothetical protein
MKKITKLALTGALALSTFAAAALPTFAAVSPDDWNIASETGLLTLPAFCDVCVIPNIRWQSI